MDGGRQAGFLHKPQAAPDQRASHLGPQGRVSKPPSGGRRSPAGKAAPSRPSYLPSTSLKDVGWTFGAAATDGKADSEGGGAAAGRGAAKQRRPAAQSAIFKEHGSTVVPAAALAAVTYRERVRAVCAMAQIGNAARGRHSAAAVKAAANALRSGDAFKGNVYADDVSAHLKPPPDA